MIDPGKTKAQLLDELTRERQKYAALESNVQQYRRLLDEFPSMIFRLSIPDGHYEYVSQGALQVTGYSPEEIMNHPLYIREVIHPDFIPFFKQEWERILSGQVESLYEYKITDRAGNTRLMQQKNVLIRDAAGKPAFLEGIVTDITERRTADEELRKSRAFLYDLIEHSGALICIKDRKGLYEFVNQKWEEVTGLKRRDTLGRTDMELFPGPTGEQFHLNDLEAMKSGTVLEKEEILEDASGKRYFISIKFPVRDNKGTIHGLCGMITEITARKKTEDELRTSKERLSRAESISRSGHWEFDLNSKKVLASEGTRRIYGLPEGDWTIPEIQKIPLPEYRPLLDRALTDLISGCCAYNVEFKIKRPDTGDIVDVHSVAEYDNQRNIVFGIIQDVTERKRLEETLVKRDEILRLLTENMSDMIRVADMQGNNIYVSPSHFRGLGYKTEERFGRAGFDIIHPADVERVIGTFIDGIAANQPVRIEYRVKHADGRYVWLETTADALRDEKGEATAVVMNSRDISTRKQAEQALQESERLYRTFINASSDMVFLKDECLRNIGVNQALASFFGKPEGEIIGKTDFELMPQTAAEKCRETDLQALENQSTIISEETIGDQTYETLKFSVELGNNKIGIGGFIRNITARKQAEEELQRLNVFLDSIVENIPNMIFVKDARDLRFVRFNRAGEELLGYSRDDLLGKNDFDFFPRDQAEFFMDKDQNTLLKKEIADIPEESIQTRNKGVRILHTKKVPIMDGNGKPAYLMGISEDITDRKLAEEEKQNLAERLNRAEKMEGLGRLAGGVAHDLNNILGILVGYSELLRDSLPQNSSFKGYADNILQAGLRGSAIIQDLLTLARRGVAVSQVVDLNGIVADYLRTPEYEKLRLEHKKVNVHIDLATNLLKIKGSPIHLSKTIANLVFNAAEAISEHGEISVKTENRYLDTPVQGYDTMQEGDYAVLTVSDTGKGISTHDMGKIFEPFYTKKVMGKSGTGLGLAVVWGTVKDHNGYIDVRSIEGEGTTFTLYFPVTREEITKQVQPANSISYMGKGEFILIVDDMKEQRELAATMMKRLGYQVDTVAGGEEAVLYIKNKKTDLIILDMIMEPGMDGMETFRRILEIHPQQKAIIVSGFSENDRVRNTREMGAGTFVRKPYVLEKIGLAVRTELDKK